MNKISSLLIGILLSSSVCAQDLSQYFKIYDTRTKSLSSLQSIVARTNDYDILFFGEEHNDSIGHFIQDTLYKALIAEYKNVTLSMEMFERDCQIVVDEYVDGIITEAQLIKEGRAWKNYKDYANLVNTARTHHQKVVAANAPRRYVNLVNRKGLSALNSLEDESKKYLHRCPSTPRMLYMPKGFLTSWEAIYRIEICTTRNHSGMRQSPRVFSTDGKRTKKGKFCS